MLASVWGWGKFFERAPFTIISSLIQAGNTSGKGGSKKTGHLIINYDTISLQMFFNPPNYTSYEVIIIIIINVTSRCSPSSFTVTVSLLMNERAMCKSMYLGTDNTM